MSMLETKKPASAGFFMGKRMDLIAPFKVNVAIAIKLNRIETYATMADFTTRHRICPTFRAVINS